MQVVYSCTLAGKKKVDLKSIPAEEIKISVSVAQDIVKNLYEHALRSTKLHTKTNGFDAGSTSLHYLKKNYNTSIIEHITEVLLIYYVYERALMKLSCAKASLVTEPRISQIFISPDSQNNTFDFIADPLSFEQKINWKSSKLKFPVRKKYKDLDKQAELIITTEKNLKTAYAHNFIVAKGDWVKFSLKIVDDKNHAHELIKDHEQFLWIKVSGEEVDQESCNLFFGKKKDEEFITSSSFLNKYIAPSSVILYDFKIKIIEIVPCSYFCFESFQNYLNLKSSKEIPNKIIEILSFRNDVSLKREVSQIILENLSRNHTINLSKNIIDEQKKIILDRVINNPDYLVYQAQRDFVKKIAQLAEKQLFESMIIDYIAQQETINPTAEDIKSYVNIMQRPRFRDFIYFDLPESKYCEREQPVLDVNLFIAVRREKMLNYMINYLLKNN